MHQGVPAMIRYLRALHPGDRWSLIVLIVAYGALAASFLRHVLRALL